MRPSVRPQTFLNSNISATSGPIVTKFYLKHHWGGGLIALGFRPGRIGTLVSMATDSSHRVIMGENVVSTLAPSFLIGSSSYLQVTRTFITSRTSSKFDQIGPRTAELAALERPEESPWTYNGINLVNTLAPSFLNQSSSFLQITRTCMKAWMSSNFGQITTPTPELSALARLKNCCIMLCSL